MSLGVDVLNKITQDVLGNVPVERSKLTYTGEMLRARADIEADIATFPPGTIVDLPHDVADLDVPDYTLPNPFRT